MPAAPTTPLAPLHLLLVEDNPINQQVALQALAQAGHTVDMAPNGREALRILPMRPYDVILMDVQMPEMDGLETTRRIRAQAGATGRHVPIIAMTAHVMPGDQARCLAAGMDDYVAKPLQPDDLHAALRRVMTPAGPLRQAAAPVDLSVALTSAEGNTTFLHQLVQLFLPYASQQVSALRDALQAQDVRSVERLAHALRGAARALGAQAVDTLAARFETMGDDDPLTDTQSTLQSLEHELERIRDFFATSDWENFL
jgi:CheY-like chemotaxis protein